MIYMIYERRQEHAACFRLCSVDTTRMRSSKCACRCRCVCSVSESRKQCVHSLSLYQLKNKIIQSTCHGY